MDRPKTLCQKLASLFFPKTRAHRANQRLTTVGTTMPEDFPSRAYQSINSCVVRRKDTCPGPWGQYAQAWNALAYRFLSCTEHDEAFTSSIKSTGSSPPPHDRYIQERELFGFFVTGLAAIESLCYGLFAIGSMLNPADFPLQTAEDMKKVTPNETAAQFANIFPNERVSNLLRQVTNDQCFKDWNDIRNIMAHRGAPSRLHHVGGPQHGETLWVKGIPIDETTTKSWRTWLTRTIGELLAAADIFTSQRLST